MPAANGAEVARGPGWLARRGEAGQRLGQHLPDQLPELVGPGSVPAGLGHGHYSGSPSSAVTASDACRTSSSRPDR